MATDTTPRSGRDGDRDGDQPLPTPGCGDVLGSLIEKLEERRRVGMERYGRPLETFNGRDAFQDHEEELIDGHNYAEQIRLEYRALWAAVCALGRAARGEPVDAALLASALALSKRLDDVDVRNRPTPERIAEVAGAVEAQRRAGR